MKKKSLSLSLCLYCLDVTSRVGEAGSNHPPDMCLERADDDDA